MYNSQGIIELNKNEIAEIAQLTCTQLNALTNDTTRVCTKDHNWCMFSLDCMIDGEWTPYGGGYDIMEWNGKGVHIVNVDVPEYPAYFKIVRNTDKNEIRNFDLIPVQEEIAKLNK